MPTYEYKCEACQRRVEVFQRMSEPPLTECTECHGKLKRLIGTGAGFLFKGSGFYVTDYRSDSYRQGAKRAGSDTAASPSAASPSAASPTSPTAPAAPAATSSPAAAGTKSGSTEKKQP